jgi:hypothetical protein
MSFDELQQQWKDEPLGDVQIPTEMDVLKKAQTPIDEVRERMKKDFIIQTSLRVLTLFVPLLFNFTDSLSNIFYTFYFTILVFVFYYNYKFYVFYKHSYNLLYDSRKNLLWFYYELKLNIELLKASAFISTLLSGILGILIGWNIKKDNLNTFPIVHILDGINPIFVNIGLIVFAILVFFYIENLPKLTYGKHLEKIKIILDELDEL